MPDLHSLKGKEEEKEPQLEGSWKVSDLSELYFGYWDERAHCVWFIQSLSGVCILRIRVFSGKKGMIHDIELIIHVLFCLFVSRCRWC